MQSGVGPHCIRVGECMSVLLSVPTRVSPHACATCVQNAHDKRQAADECSSFKGNSEGAVSR